MTLDKHSRYQGQDSTIAGEANKCRCCKKEEETNIGSVKWFGSSTLVVLSNKEKVARAGLVRERTPPQCVRNEFFGGDIPQCRSALVS
jgi:hypothetical protein